MISGRNVEGFMMGDGWAIGDWQSVRSLEGRVKGVVCALSVVGAVKKDSC